MPDESSIRIRMYRVGFGDCFLVTFPTSGGVTHILVDCGVHVRGDAGTIQKVVQNVAAETGEKLALVIATHAHQDHISGFGKFAPVFRKFQINEVWMPWTEDKSDPDASKLKQKQKTAVARLQMYFQSLAPAARAQSEDAMQAIANLAGNEAALDQLHSGFGVGAKVRYWKAGESCSAPGGVLGLEAQILGPPTDPDFLARMDPPPAQHYITAESGGNAQAAPPFTPRWFDTEHSQRVCLSEREIGAIEGYASEPPDGLAFTMDQIVNNTSLVILFSFGGKYLLFAGDAQYGNWQYWLEKSDSAHILGEIDFLKVAHHGSVNATPKQAIDNMGSRDLAAMVSTQNTPWPSIPREPLLQAILKRTENRMARSDALDQKGTVKSAPPGFTRGDFWFDYQIPV